MIQNATRNKYKFLSGVEVSVSSFESGTEVGEHHLIFSTKDDSSSVEEKIGHILLAFQTLKKDYFLGGDLQPVFSRWFLSDAANQARHIDREIFDCASSIVEQPPLDGSKVALWLYCLNDVKTEKKGENSYSVKHGNYTHYWQGNRTNGILDSETSTLKFLKDYSKSLANDGCSLKDNCIRTWFFVRDVDNNYKGVVTGRNKIFDEEDLNSRTHFIASTGIGGNTSLASELVSFNAYSVKGVRSEQITYLKGFTHLNPTIEYGVAFERGTAVDYGDRRHIFISGTASIDNKGNVLFPGDIRRQTMRVWENVEVLLKEAGADWENVGHLIVYLRDLSDFKIVSEMFRQSFPDIPTVITLAPVCRPGWLIEMECMACKPQVCPDYAVF